VVDIEEAGVCYAGRGQAGLLHLLDKLCSASYIVAAGGEFRLDVRQLGTLAVELGLEGKGLA
jgi:hypothetical protein